MPSCCYGDDYGSVFTAEEASALAGRYRRNGLAGSARDLVSMLGERALAATSLLEVGGGVGEIQLSLLESGIVQRVTNVELSPNWESAAQRLLEERGVTGQVLRLVANFVDQAAVLPAADLVVLHKVVCCYPDWQSMLGAGIGKTKQMLALTFPDDHWWSRVFISIGNVFFRLRGIRFRGYVHPPGAMLALARAAGLAVVADRRRLVWRTVLLARPGRASQPNAATDGS